MTARNRGYPNWSLTNKKNYNSNKTRCICSKSSKLNLRILWEYFSYFAKLEIIWRCYYNNILLLNFLVCRRRIWIASHLSRHVEMEEPQRSLVFALRRESFICELSDKIEPSGGCYSILGWDDVLCCVVLCCRLTVNFRQSSEFWRWEDGAVDVGRCGVAVPSLIIIRCKCECNNQTAHQP